MASRMNLKAVAIAMISGLVCTAAQAECLYPEVDEVRIPSGRSASEAEMVAAISEVKAFQATMAAFRACLDEELAAGEQPPAREAVQLHNLRFNASISVEEELAARLNAQIHAYREANPGQ